MRKLKKGARWWYKFDFAGSTYFSTAIYSTKNEARKAENRRYDEIINRQHKSSQKSYLRLLEAINERLDYIKTKKSNKYYYDCKKYYKGLFDYIGDKLLFEITRNDINKYLLIMSESLKSKNKDNYAANAALRVYKALFNYVIQNHEVEIKNPCIGISLFSINRKLKYIPKRKDIDEVLEMCDSEERLLITFIEQTGARVSEALRLTGADVSPGHVILRTRKSRNSDLMPRRVPLTLELPKINDDERLFKRWNNRPQFLEVFVKQLGQRTWNFHNLRHRRASIWANLENRPIYEVMNLLGHKNLSTTQGYLQMLEIVAGS
ncbi:MAG TPA: site-specific integrase [Ignavibacteria bacterium]|nr:site-specific integrase [Ignavibacteria bacterium]